MNPDVILVIFLVIGIVVVSNLAMFALVRGSRGMNFDWFKNMRGPIDRPFEGNALDELHRRVEELQDSDKGDRA